MTACSVGLDSEKNWEVILQARLHSPQPNTIILLVSLRIIMLFMIVLLIPPLIFNYLCLAVGGY